MARPWPDIDCVILSIHVICQGTFCEFFGPKRFAACPTIYHRGRYFPTTSSVSLYSFLHQKKDELKLLPGYCPSCILRLFHVIALIVLGKWYFQRILSIFNTYIQLLIQNVQLNISAFAMEMEYMHREFSTLFVPIVFTWDICTLSYCYQKQKAQTHSTWRILYHDHFIIGWLAEWHKYSSVHMHE